MVDSVDYVDLELVDSDVVAIVARAVEDLTVKFPELVLFEGSLESVLIEAFATITAEAVYAANRVPGKVLEDLLALYGLPRDAGEFPQASLQFTLADNGQARTVPLGTRVLVTNVNGDAMVFGTNADLVIPSPGTVGTVDAVGDDYSAAFNGTQTLTVELVDSVSYVEAVEVTGAVTDGRDPETTEAYLDRGAARLARLTSTLVRADQFALAAMEDPAVARALAVDLYDPNQVPPDNRAGHVTVAVLGALGAVLTPEQKTAIEAALEAQAIAVLDVHVVDVTVTPVNVTVDVEPVAGVLAADVRASVEAQLAEYLDPGSWSFGDTVYVNELISVIDQAPGVKRVIDLTAPAADVSLAGVGPVADLGVAVVLVGGVAP